MSQLSNIATNTSDTCGQQIDENHMEVSCIKQCMGSNSDRRPEEMGTVFHLGTGLKDARAKRMRMRALQNLALNKDDARNVC